MNSTAYIHSMKPSYIALRYIIMSFAVSASQQGKRKLDMEYFKLNSTKSKNRVKTRDLELVSGVNLLL